MDVEIPLAKLQEDIHTALRSWHNTASDDSSLAYLQLFRQARRVGVGNARRLTNEILLNALDSLALEHKSGADLLRQHFLDGALVQTIANQLNVGQATIYRRQQEALQHLTLVIQTSEKQARASYQATLESQLELPPAVQLFGIEDRLTRLLAQLLATSTPWLVSLEGLGGLGKTALANAVVRRSELLNRFAQIAWVSAKQRNFMPGPGLAAETSPALTLESLTDALLEQLGQTALLSQPAPEKRTALIQFLKQTSYLLVIDNLETMTDYHSLMPLLTQITNPSKVLLTSRYSLQIYSEVFCLSLDALTQAEAFQLIRHEATTRGLTRLAEATESQLQAIYEGVGGHPLALKLVVGQIAFLPLTQVLAHLQQAQGHPVTDLYTYIYWQAWHMLTEVSRQTLLVMPLLHEGTWEQLLAFSQLESEQLQQALQQLITLSLVQVAGSLEERRYAIHRLTETFLLTEAIAWPSSS